MLAGVGKFFSNVKSYYNEINSATLTGAIDIVVVEQPDGTYESSPFHVRFGKLGVIRSREKVVYIEINGEPTDLQMKLGPAGEAFFVQGVRERWEGPEYMATSPIQTSPLTDGTVIAARASKSDFALKATKSTKSSKAKSHLRRVRRETELSQSSSSSASDLSSCGARKDIQNSFSFKPINHQEDDEMLESGGMFEIEVSDDESRLPVPDLQSGMSKAISLPLIQESRISRTENWAISSTYHKSSQFHPFSDTDITPLVSPVGSRPHTPKSDTECEYADRKATVSAESEELQQWNWGELPASSQQLAHTVVSNEGEPIAVPSPDDQSSGLWSFMKSTKKIRHKPEEGGIYLDDINLQEMEPELKALYFPKTSRQLKNTEADCEVDKATASHVINMPDDDAESGHGASLPHSPDPIIEVRNALTPTSETGTMKDHDCRFYGDMAMSLCGGVIDSYTNVSPEIFNQYIIDYETLSQKPTETLQHSDLIIRIGGKYYNWIAAAPMIMSMTCFHQTLPENAHEMLIRNTNKKPKMAGRSSWWPFGRTAKSLTTDVEAGGSQTSTPNGSPKKTPVLSSSQHDKISESGDEADDEKDKPALEPLTVDTTTVPTTEPIELPADKHYVKTLRLTTEEVERLNLHEGENEIEFSVTTSYQGTSTCVAHIYLWKNTDKIIISDIDGTITKSDVLGQILPMVGKDWSQYGVTELFTKIAENGYKFAYLSARAIGQAQITRDYLKSVKQGELSLPPGPLFLNPSSLINAFHKEVIEKKPEEFKIRCMTDIKSLFPTDVALYAGFGNRINDIYAYRAVGIPKSRIFLIDKHGKVKSDFCETFQTSYSHLSDITDHYFPPLEEVGGESAFHAPAEYSNFTYWREPMAEISLELPE